MAEILSSSQHSSISSQPDYDRHYEAPSMFYRNGDIKPEKVKEAELQVWIQDCVSEGTNFITSNRPYSDINKAIETLSLRVDENVKKTLSNMWVNNTKRNIREMAAILSNIRPSWVYEANESGDETLLKHARIQNGLDRDWYKRAFVDRKLKSLLQLSLVEATGYISPIWNPSLDIYGNNQGGIELKLYRFNEILPIQIGKDFDLQRAYAVILIDELPLNRARKLFWRKASQIHAERGEPRMANKIVQSAMTFWDAIKLGDRQQRKTYPSPNLDILYIYVDDYSINPTNQPIQMGEASWKYEVPFVGQQIFDYYDKFGKPSYRNAKPEDCLLYPNRRLIIATKTCILYDGPSYWWHGKVPIIKYSPDEWIFSYLGHSLAAEVLTLNRSANKMRRSIEDALHLKINPPTQVDEISVPKTIAENSTLRNPGFRLRRKLGMGEMMKPILDPSYYHTEGCLDYVKEVEEKIAWVLGLPDLRSLAQANQVPSTDSIEKFFASAGTLVTDMSRSLDPVMFQMADMNRYLFCQFFDLPRRIRILGESGIADEDFDYKPGTLVPVKLPNEVPNAQGVYESDYLLRAKAHCSNFSTSIEPTSLHQISHMQQKLLKMQAVKISPFLISLETLAKTLDIQNWGKSEGDTEIQKVISEMKQQQQLGLQSQMDQAKMQLMIQLMAQQIMQAMNPQAQLMNSIGGVADAMKNDLQGGQNLQTNGNEGRPPSFEKSPQLVQKLDGRSTVTTS